MKRTVQEQVNEPYSLHDMNVIGFEVVPGAEGDMLIMRTQSGMVRTAGLSEQVDGYVEFHNVQWEFCHVYIMDITANEGTFQGEKLYLQHFSDREKAFGFSIMDTAYGYNQVKYSGYLTMQRKTCECVIEIYHEGNLVFVEE